MLTVNSLEPARSQKNRTSLPVAYSKRAASVTQEIVLGQNSKKSLSFKQYCTVHCTQLLGM